MSLVRLKSGTDIRGSAVGESMELTDSAVERITCGFLGYMTEKTGLSADKMTVYVGHDSRISAERIKNAIIGVLTAHGVKVYDCGLSSTPAMFMTTVKKGCTASIQITASHHPYDKNGIKFFTENGGFEGDEIQRILEMADCIEEVKTAECVAEKVDFMSEYAEGLKEMIKTSVNAEIFDKPLDGFKIAVDAGNGVGGFFERVLSSLGADTRGSQFLEPDGCFPNHIPNPENETAMSFISKAVTESGADLGIIFDTDVDRAACVDKNGREINRNSLIALAGIIALENNPGATIVTDSVTSDGLKRFINCRLGGVHYRYKRGYKNVINKAIELNGMGINCPLAIETSGHAALRENYFLDDGAYLMTKIIILAAKLKKEGKTVSSLLEHLEMPFAEKEKRYIIELEDFKEYGERVISDFAEYCKGFARLTPADDNREGFRVSFGKEDGDGWLLLRMSVHDPVLPLNMESNSEGGIEKIEKFFDGFIKNYEKLHVK